MTLVRQIRDEIVSAEIPASVVLRRAKILAASLHNAALQEWLTLELNGYPNGSSLPEYRRLVTAVLGNFSGPFGSSITGYLIPTTMLPDVLRRGADQLPIAQPLREIEALCNSRCNTLRHTWPTESVMFSRDQVRLTGGYELVELYQPISLPSLEGIIDSVRTRFLDFLLGLQELNEQVLDSENVLTRLSKDDVAQVFNVTVHGDHNFIAANSDVGRVSMDNVTTNDLAGLAEFVKNIGLTSEDAKALEVAIVKDGAPSQKTIGAHVQQWMGTVLAKAVGGSWEIALATAPEILKKAIFRYYGWE